MLLQVLHDLETQSPHISALPAATLAANDVITSAANLPEELLSIPDPSDDGSVIQFCVPRSSQAASASLQAPSGHIASMTTPHGGCANTCQPLWRPCSGLLQEALRQTAGLLQEISHMPSPLLPPVTCPFVTCPATVSAQPLKALASCLVGSLRSNVRHSGVHSTPDGQSAARESGRLCGYTFCGKPRKFACWLSDLCQHLPGALVSDSQVWALGSGSHPYSAVKLAGLQQLAHQAHAAGPPAMQH